MARENGLCLLSEEWMSRKHHQNYIRFISENGAMQALQSFMEGPPAVKHFEKLPV